MATAKINGIHIHYESHGVGEPLLLIQGLGANATGWAMQIPEFSRKFRVVIFDNRGAGRSEKPNEPYTMSQMADDAAGVLDKLGIGSAHVFGMSLGGMIAQELALSRRERVRTLVLGGTMCGGPKATFAGAELVIKFISLMGLPIAEAIEAGLSLVYSDEFIAAKKDELVSRALENIHLTAPSYALQRQFMAVVGFNTYDRLPSLRIPTLVLAGTDDKVMPAANAHVLADVIPGARLVQFEGAGHGFIVERAEEVNATVLEFLRGHQTEPMGSK